MPAPIRKQAISSLPPIERSKPSPRDDSQASSSSAKPEKGGLAFDRLFLAKRPRFVDEDEEEDRNTKRGKYEEKSGSKGTQVGKPAIETDYMGVLKIVRVNLSNLKLVTRCIA